PDTRVHAYCSNVAPLAGSKRSTAAIRASSPHDTRSSSSQWAGSSRTFRHARYLTIGAYESTRRSRAATSLFWIQARHNASAVPAVGRELDTGDDSTKGTSRGTRAYEGARCESGWERALGRAS